MGANQSNPPIPVNSPILDGKEKEYLLDCIESGFVSSEGPYVDRFEKAYARRVGRSQGIAVANGTAAVEIAVRALDLAPGSEVIMPAFTIISCAGAVTKAGLLPVLVDCMPDTWNMDVAQVAAKITPRTRAIMVVHIYGLPVDVQPILDLARLHQLFVIEDAAQAIGQTYRGKECGSFGDITAVSFYPNKLITTGEGGMCLVDDGDLANRCRSLRNLCFQPERRFVHEELGWNYRMSNLQAAVGCAQLERLDAHVTRKREIGRRYQTRLSGLRGCQLPRERTEYAENIYWVFGIVLSDDVSFDASIAMLRLGRLGIGTRPFFYPIHLQPVYRKAGLFLGESYPVAERIAERGFYIPSGLGVTDAQVDRVSVQLRGLLSEGA